MSTEPTPLEVVKILVVDDHPENILALRASLSRPDYEIIEAHSGEEALKRVLQHDFAVILLDILMPRMDGFEVASLIRERKASRHTPIIFLTAGSSENDLVFKGYSVGAVDYLVKPISPNVVKAKVAVFVDLYRKELRLRQQERALRDADRERGERAIHEREELYRATFDRAAVGIAHTDSSWLLTRVNPRFVELTGFTPDALLHLRLPDLAPPDDGRELVEGLQRMIAQGSDTWAWQGKLRHQSGAAWWASLTLSAIRAAEGTTTCFVAIVEDVTERHLSHERQRFLSAASECLLGSLQPEVNLGQLAELVVDSVADWCLVEAGIGGHPPWDEVAATARVPALSPGFDALREWLRTRTAEAAGGAYTLPELTTPSRDDATCGLAMAGVRSVMLVPLWVRGRVLGRVLMATQGTERGLYRQGDLMMAEDLAHRIALALDNTRLYQAAQEAVHARDEFLSIASHELRTPLTPLQIAFQRYLGPRAKEPLESLPMPQLRSLLARSDRQVQRLIVLVDKLLDVSRITGGVLDLEMQSLDLTELVRDVAERFAEELSRAGCELHLEMDGPLLGRWDRLRLEQVVSNLLSNAIKYGAGKPVEIGVMTADGDARVVVRDHGIGIDPQELGRIFGRFERAVSSRTFGGLGLGLYLARQIADAHGGSVSVTSEPGAGAVFVISLPMSAEADVTAGRPPERTHGLQLGA